MTKRLIDEEYLWRDVVGTRFADYEVSKRLKRTFFFPREIWEMIKEYFIDDGYGAIRRKMLSTVKNLRRDLISTIYPDADYIVWSLSGTILVIYNLSCSSRSYTEAFRFKYWTYQYRCGYQCEKFATDWFSSSRGNVLRFVAMLGVDRVIRQLQGRLNRKMHAEWNQGNRPGSWITWRKSKR